VPITANHGQPRVVVCETVAAITHHFRLDDGERKLGGGLDPSTFLCKSSASNGWDTRVPPPTTPVIARVQDRRFRENRQTGYCQACIEAWEKLWVEWEAKG
jgi:hypothetical protein